jgi:hypothetical protein
MSSSNVIELFENSEEHSLEEQLGLLAEITQSFAVVQGRLILPVCDYRYC